jgi:hypothetical protein
MTAKRWIVDAFLAAAAIVFAYWGAVVMRAVISFGPIFFEEHSGGLGAVSGGFSESILVAIIGSLIANRLLAGVARRASGPVKTLHRAHSVTCVATLGCVAMLAVIAAVSLIPARPLILLFCLTSSLLALQFWFLSALLIALIRRRATALAVF